MAIADKLNHVKEVKQGLKETLDKTNQDTNVPFRQYSNLIENIPNTGAITYNQIDELTRLAIKISGEKA